MLIEGEKLDKMLLEAKTLLEQSECKSFSISSVIPKEWLVEEEKDFDKNITKSRTVKAKINYMLIKEIVKNQTKKCTNDADVKIVFDFNTHKVSLSNEPIFIFGRYKKLEKEISQSRWLCKKCEGEGCFKCYYKGKNYTSVEELIGEHFKELAKSSNYIMHASGREDVDVINIAGRPFVLEIINPKNISLDLNEADNLINAQKEVAVENLKKVPRSFVELVSNSHFDKEYIAEVELERDVTKEDTTILSGFKGVIDQQTPQRVAHRRSDLLRKRLVKDISVVSSEKNKVKIKIFCEPGTYIKELISSDKGRTNPSISSLLKCNAKCTSLIVSKINDGFLDLFL